MEYIHWLSKNDWALSVHLRKMDEIFNNYVDEKEYKDINEIMELFVVCKYMNAHIYPSIWSENTIDRNIRKVKNFKGVIGKYFNSIKNDNLISISNMLDFHYKKLFWEAFKTYKLFRKIEFSYIKELINDNEYVVMNIMYEKDIVDAYGKEIRKELLILKKAAEWLLDEYELYHIGEREQLHFPKELTAEDKKQIIGMYINWEYANFNYLRIIVNVQDNPYTLIVGDKLRLQAKKRIKEEQEKMFSVEPRLKIEMKVIFTELESDEPEVHVNSYNITCKYNINWIKENLDEFTVLNNYIYWFGYMDMQGRITLVEKDIHKGIFERFVFMRSKYAYEPGYSAQIKNMLADIQMNGYYQQLKKFGVRLEDVLKWFFEEYLKTKFLIKGFRMNVPSLNSSYLEKCRMMLSEMDGILKQYNLYVEDGYVDQELFQMSSSHMKFSDCRSAVNEKYVYGEGEKFKISCHHLFSDQSHITYVERIEKSYNSFYDLLKNEIIFETDFDDYTKPIFVWLINGGFILIENNQIKFNNLVRVNLLKQINDNDVISYWHLDNELKAEIKKMENEDLVVFKSSLFTKKEYEYFDYYLNKARFNNGTDLRNMYIHGSQPNSPEDENIHMSNYWIILKLFVLCVLKIGDDIEIMTNNEKRIENLE